MTLTKPKPLQPVGGRAMLDHALDKLVAAGIKRAVVNTHYLAEQIEEHLKTRRDIEIVISREEKLLDTGGGIVRALPYFDEKPFFVLNADLPWLDGALPSLSIMRESWNPDAMDTLLLLMRTEKARGFSASGDFMMESDGRVWRKGFAPPRPFVLISAQIMKPELFAHFSAEVFSNNVIWNAVEETRQLYGVEHDGTCYHVGTPEDWREANALLELGAGWGV